MRSKPNNLAVQDAALKTLAIQTKTPEEEVNRVYESEVERLEAEAKVRTYIPAIALHRARARLSPSRRASRGAEGGAESVRRTRRSSR